MQPEGTAVKSALDKPLHQLTEDDIAQLTREDCRRYLKQKGMRRPSWNKSQAIQQVIMLKALLETTPDYGTGSHRRLRISRVHHRDNDTNIPESVAQGTRCDAENSISAEGTTPYREKDPDTPDSSGVFSGRFLAANSGSTLSRTTSSSSLPVGQMTIFYCGKVNVYDDVPEDKARSIMHLAASPVHFLQEQPVDGTIMMQTLPCFSKAVCAKACLDSAVVLLPTLQTVKMTEHSRVLREESNILREENRVEGLSTRKASVQRYLDKRKDRFKSKGKAGITSRVSLDMYINNQRNNQVPNEPLSRSDIPSPPQIRPPSTPTRCSSVDNDSLKNVYASTDLNDRGLWASNLMS